MLEGRSAIVTGGGGGIGRAIALKLAACGCDIGVFDLDAASAGETACLVETLGRKAVVATGSVAERAEVDTGVAALLAGLGRIDILVNNAGILRTAPFLETSKAQWRQVMAINLDGAFHFCQAVLPRMLAQKSGAIVNMSSWTGKKGAPNHSAYSASKFAVIGLTQSLAGEVAKHGVRVNAVCPGIIVNTQMREQAEALNREQGLPDVETRAKSVPMRRAGQPEEIADVVAFLASDEARYMTGQALNITGGLWMN
jgi:3-oxoacyl-[acyl-carrier protein] reductase/sorbitol-6-phosphate 2-dehydrogenase